MGCGWAAGWVEGGWRGSPQVFICTAGQLRAEPCNVFVFCPTPASEGGECPAFGNVSHVPHADVFGWVWLCLVAVR